MAKKRVTIKELSQLMGVSPATITNALTNQPNVSEEKRAQIIEQARRLGYKPNLYARALVKNGIKIGCLVSIEPVEYQSDIVKGMKIGIEEFADFKVEYVNLRFSNNRADDEVYEKLREAAESDIDGLVVAPSLKTEKYAGLLRELITEKKLAVVFSPSGIESGVGVARIRSSPLTLGRMAAEILGLALPPGSDVAAITTNRYYDFHSQIMDSFKDECAGQNLSIVATLENEDSAEMTYNCAKALISMYPSLKGIYVTSFNTVPVCEYVKEAGLEGKIKIVGHDVFPEMVDYIKDGTMLASLFQNPVGQGRLAVRTLVRHIIGVKGEFQDISVRPHLVMRSNIDMYLDEFENSVSL